MVFSDGSVLDARYVYSEARYLNNSCEPNCEVREMDGADGKKHMGVFTLMDVPAGAELTISYRERAETGAEKATEWDGKGKEAGS